MRMMDVSLLGESNVLAQATHEWSQDPTSKRNVCEKRAVTREERFRKFSGRKIGFSAAQFVLVTYVEAIKKAWSKNCGYFFVCVWRMCSFTHAQKCGDIVGLMVRWMR